jgi:hypothetical protein
MEKDRDRQRHDLQRFNLAAAGSNNQVVYNFKWR